MKHKLQPKNSKVKRKKKSCQTTPVITAPVKSFPPNKKKEKEKLFSLNIGNPLPSSYPIIYITNQVLINA